MACGDTPHHYGDVQATCIVKTEYTRLRVCEPCARAWLDSGEAEYSLPLDSAREWGCECEHAAHFQDGLTAFDLEHDRQTGRRG